MATGADNGRSQSEYLVSVVIPAYNAGEELFAQLDSLTRQDFVGKWEVVIADNGTTDGSLDRLERYRADLDLRVIDAAARRGPSYARNFGAENAQGEWLAFCDADDVAAPQWLRELYEHRDQADMISGIYEVTTLNEPAVAAARGVDYWQELLRGPNDFLPFAPSGNFLIRRDIYLKLGGFDESIPGPGAEDVDFSWRVQLSGHTLALSRGAVIHYRFRGNPRAVYQQVRGYKAAEADLYLRYRDAGMGDPSSWEDLKRGGWLISRSPYLLMSARRRMLWCAVAGEFAGRLRRRKRLRIAARAASRKSD